MQENPNDDILIDAIIDQTNKLDEIAASNDVQVEGIMKTNEKLEDLSSTAELILEGMSQKMKFEEEKIQTVADEMTVTVKGLKGDQGIQGEKGDTGEAGDQGIQGIQGLQGIQGIQGIQGEKGDIGDTGLKGDKGDKGEQGDKGEKGERGLKGSKGDKGIDVDPKRVKELEDKISYALKQASKTVSLVELDDVNLTGLTQTNGKYNLGSGAGSSTWGSITGTLSAQTDLQAALDAKQGTITLTTTGTSGASTLVGNTLNIPQYSGGASSTNIYNETPGGLINSINTVFTTAFEFTTETTRVYLNGLRQTLNIDYTEGVATITFASAIITGDVLRIDYERYETPPAESTFLLQDGTAILIQDGTSLLLQS